VADASDDLARAQAMPDGKGVQLVEVRHPQRKVCVGEQLDGLGLGAAREQDGGVRVFGALLQYPGDVSGGRSLTVRRRRVPNDDVSLTSEPPTSSRSLAIHRTLPNVTAGVAAIAR